MDWHGSGKWKPRGREERADFKWPARPPQTRCARLATNAVRKKEEVEMVVGTGDNKHGLKGSSDDL